MFTDRELELVKEFDAEDYDGFLRESADVKSEWILGYYRFCCFAYGRGVPRDRIAARKELVPVLGKIVAEAESGDGVAQNTMGVLMEFGYPTESGFVPPDAVSAKKWYLRSAESGCVKGQYNYGRMCKDGKGGGRDADEALKWWRASADQGDSKTQYALAKYLSQLRKTSEAGLIARYLRSAAAAGLADASRVVGHCADDFSDSRVYAELLIDIAGQELKRRRDPFAGVCFSINVSDDSWLLANQPKGSKVPPAGEPGKVAIPDLKRTNASFSAMLIKYVRDRFGGDAPGVYRAARINRKTYSAIISNELRAVSKRTAVAFAFALRLSRTEADELLRTAGFAFSMSILEDIIFGACIDAGIYDLARVNQILVNHQARPFPDPED